MTDLEYHIHRPLVVKSDSLKIGNTQIQQTASSATPVTWELPDSMGLKDQTLMTDGAQATTWGYVESKSMSAEGRTPAIGSNVAISSHTTFVVSEEAKNGRQDLTLPDPSSYPFFLIVKDISGLARTNRILINPFSTEKIDGDTSIEIRENYGSVKLYSDGTDWFTIK